MPPAADEKEESFGLTADASLNEEFSPRSSVLSESEDDRTQLKKKRKHDENRNRTTKKGKHYAESSRRKRKNRRRESRRRGDPSNRRAGVVSCCTDDDEQGQKSLETTSKKKRKQKNRSASVHDDSTGHYQGKVGDVINDRYRIVGQVGLGTFGKVLECRDREFRSDTRVAIKVVRNIPRYTDSARLEASIVGDVNRRGGRGVTHFVELHEAFMFDRHFCLVFESLGPSLYDFMKENDYQPFPMHCVRDFCFQILEALEFLHSFRLIHTDLKVENILLVDGRSGPYGEHGRQRIPYSTRIKLIDFGGSCYDDERKSRVVNTRQYRAPEVIFETGWSMPSDVWSAGCILVELFQGDLLFATHGNLEHLALMERVLGLFPYHVVERAKKSSELAREAFGSDNRHRLGRVLDPESVDYVKGSRRLEEIIRHPDDGWFLGLLRHMLDTDARSRWTAHECLNFLHRDMRHRPGYP